MVDEDKYFLVAQVPFVLTSSVTFEAVGVSTSVIHRRAESLAAMLATSRFYGASFLVFFYGGHHSTIAVVALMD